MSCIGVDGKVDDDTLIMRTEEGYITRCKGQEHHLTFTTESGEHQGEYLTHRTIPLKGSTGKLLAGTTYEVLEEFNSTRSIRAILVDNTSSNTGFRNGMIKCLEDLLERKLHLLGCGLHLNELPFRSLFKHLDGTTSGPRSFNGMLGQACSSDIWLEPISQYQKVEGETSTIVLSEAVLKDLSMDQRLLYDYACAIESGSLELSLARKHIGPHNHPRWLTLATRLMCLYTRTVKPSKELQLLINYILKVYVPSWFHIKITNSLSDLPQIIFKAAQHVKTMESKYQNKIKAAFQRSSFCFLPENFIYCLITSNSLSTQSEGWKLVLKSRSMRNKSSGRILPINWDATEWTEMISLKDKNIIEPPCTQDIPSKEVSSFLNGNGILQIEKLPSHSQSVERTIKMVSKASKLVYGQERRHQLISSQNTCGRLRSNFQSKGFYTENFDYFFQ